MINVPLIAMLALALLCMPSHSQAAECSYSKTLASGAYSFAVASRPVMGCSVQVIQITVIRKGKPYARFKTDADMVVENAWVDDLDQDGTPELVVISRSSGKDAYGMLDVYYLAGAQLKRVGQPDLAERTGYRGQDRYSRSQRTIVRTIPVYRADDVNGTPSGGTRAVSYRFAKGKLTADEPADTPAPETAAPTPAPAAAPAPATSPESKTPAAAPMPPAAAPAPAAFPPAADSSISYHVSEKGERVIVVERNDAGPGPRKKGKAGRQATGSTGKPMLREITAAGNAIELRGSGFGRFKTIKLGTPERLALDFADGASPLSGKSVAINAYGITTVRVGTSPGTLRIVLDTDLPSFPRHTINPFEGGLKITLER